MKKIVLHRPKSIEKYYDETKYRIYINDQLVGKLKRNETLEIEAEGDVVDIQARYSYWGSRKERIELANDLTEVNVAKNQKIPYTSGPNNGYIMLLVFFLSLSTNLLGLKSTWGQAIIAIFLIAFLFYIVKYHIMNRHNWILIKKRSEGDHFKDCNK